MTLDSKDHTAGSQSIRVAAGQANQSIVFEARFLNDTYLINTTNSLIFEMAVTSSEHSVPSGVKVIEV